MRYALEGKFQEAKSEFEGVLKINPSYTPAKLSLQIIEDVTNKKVTKELAIQLFRGRDYAKKSMWDEAIAEFKPIALANVRLTHEQLGKRIPIIGAGGVNSGVDVFEFLLAGAAAVQVDTAFIREGVGLFSRLATELCDLMSHKSYQSVEPLVGKLKT